MLANTVLTLTLALLGASAAPAAPAKRAGNQATYYDVGLGACGWTNTNEQAVVALNAPQWDGGAHCGKNITVTDPSSGRTTQATIVDLCPGCASGDLDMSPSLFQTLFQDLGLGRVAVSFEFDA